jgi:DNA repair exonuclease SbcCD ATPase subunit
LIDKFGIDNREVLAEEIASFLLNDDTYENINNFLKNFNKTLSEINAENAAIENDISDVKDKISNLYIEQKKCQETLKKLDILKNEKAEIQNQIDEILEQFKDYEKGNNSDIKACKDEIIHLEKLYSNKTKELNIQLTTVRKEHNKCNEDIVDLRNNLKNIDNEKENELSMLKLRLEKHSDNIETFKSNKDKFISNLIVANKDISKELVSVDIEKEDKISKMKNRISELDLMIEKNKELLIIRISEIAKSVNEYEEKIIELEKSDYSNNEEIVLLANEITELTKTADFNYNKYTEDYNKFIIFDTIHKMLTKKNNIKLYIMEKFRNYLNKKLTHYSGEFKLPTTPLFDENFDILLNGENYEGLSLKSLSAGESAKLSLSVLFASMDVKKKMYNHGDFKMLLFDEILANIDINSIFDILKVLKEYSRDMFIGCIAHSVGDYLNDGTNINITKDSNGSHIQIA